MTSFISSFSARSSWQAVGASLLPVIADQLVRQVFSKKLSHYALEAASLVTSGVTYLLLSRHLPDSFKIGAPILYLAYKAAHYYFSRQTPADPSAKDAPYKPSHVDLSIQKIPPAAATELGKKTGPASGPSVSPPLGVVSTDVPVPLPVAPTAEEKAAQKETADRMNASIEAGRIAAEGFFQNIIAPFEKSQIMRLTIQIEPLPNTAAAPGEKPLKAEWVKAQIRFGSTHVFKLGKTQVEALNKEDCNVNEKTLFFWINIATPDNKGATINFIPLMMLDSLKAKSREFSLCLNEKNYQLILSFKQKQLARLKTLAQTIRTCRNVEVIQPGVVHLSGNSALVGALRSNDLAAINRARCYLMPFLKKT